MPTMKRSDFRFFHRLRVRWAEVDMQKIVFNAHYLMYFDTAIADYWRALALPYQAAMDQLEGDLYVVKATVEFHASARVDDQIEIAVSDSGVGIAPEDQAAVFEEFRQVGSDYTKKSEGTGLGLALTRQFVELHGGRIRLESAPGQGSVFTFTLPLAAQHPQDLPQEA